MGRKKESSVLVSQFIERVSSRALEDYQQILKKYADRRHGIYALYKRDKLYYVGLASSLKSRLKQHLKDKHANKWDSFSIYLTINSSHIRQLEALILHIVSPKGNKQLGKFKRAENLGRRFKKDIKLFQRQNLHELFASYSSKVERKLETRKKKVEGPILARYGFTGKKLKAEIKGKTYRALVLKSGEVRYKNKRYKSPSMAAVAALKRPANGWTFWQYERAPNDWVALDNLR